MPEINKQKILAGRKAVDDYRQAHAALHKKPYYRQVHADHTPLLEKLVNTLEELGFTSTETEFEPKKTEILAKFWEGSNQLNREIFGECYRFEGTCSHTCHGKTGGCLEDWYQRRLKETQNETLEPIGTIDQVYNGWALNERTGGLPLRCTYKLTKVKEPDIDWQWK